MKPTLIYDGDCEFCLRSYRLLRLWDQRQRLDYLPMQDPQVATRYPRLSKDQLKLAMHLVMADGEYYSGANAIPHILWRLPLGWVFAWIFYLPGVLWVAKGIYRWIAHNRYRFGCSSDSCQRRDLG